METGFVAARLVAYVLGSVEPKLNGGINFAELLDFSKEQSIAGLVCFALEKLGRLPPEYASAFVREKKLAMAREATQEIETQEIAQELNSRSIRFMLLKGCVLKKLYPTEWLRTMCDVDIQYDTAHIDQIHEIMRERGYELVSASGTDGVNLAFRRRPFMNLEFHGVLMDTDIPAYNAYFGTDFRRTLPLAGSEVCYSDEDFFVFMAAHTAKHYFLGGTGLRSVADMWLYLKKKPQLDREYVFAQLREIELDVFVKRLLGAAEVLFEGAEADEKTLNICRYVFNSRTYGTQAHFSTRKVENGNRAAYLLDRLFPNAEFMSINYPLVKKAKILLPLFWLVRLVRAVFGGGLEHSDASAVLSLPKGSFDARDIEGKPEIII